MGERKIKNIIEKTEGEKKEYIKWKFKQLINKGIKIKE